VLIGVHPTDSGGIDMAVRRAAAAGATALQVFSAKPQFYNEKIAVRPERVQRFRQAMAECGLSTSACLVHAAYVLNTASPEAEKAERAALGLAKELERTEALGAFACCFHPGSAGDGEVASAVDRAGDAVARAIAAVPGRARVLIENTAGAGRTMGRTPEEIAGMLRRVPQDLRPRAGYGLDTCHLFASGLDFTSSPAAARSLIDRFCDVIGEAPAFLHCNDSEGGFGSNRDRHALIGEGQVGEGPFGWLLSDERLRGIPLILETPHARESVAEDDATPDPNDVRMVALLRALAA
jgi:deoxyribonuclease-4